MSYEERMKAYKEAYGSNKPRNDNYKKNNYINNFVKLCNNLLKYRLKS